MLRIGIETGVGWRIRLVNHAGWTVPGLMVAGASYSVASGVWRSNSRFVP